MRRPVSIDNTDVTVFFVGCWAILAIDLVAWSIVAAELVRYL